MEEFSFYMPTRIVFQKNALENVGTLVESFGEKCLVITDKALINTGLLDPVFESLKSSDLKFEVWSDVVPNPRDVDIERGAEYAAIKGFDFLLTVGGGSAIDTAKAMAAIITNGGKCSDWYGNKLTKPIAPLVVIPTTCGTGSEVTHESIVNNTVTLEKDCIGGPFVSAVLTIIDPMVLKNLPAHIMSSTGVDALTHAVEAYVCKAANPITDALAIRAIELIGKSLIDAVEKRADESLEDVMIASTMAGAAFGNSDVASVHSISEALGGYYDIPHGVANSMMLAAVSRLSIPGAIKKYADVAKALGVETSSMTDEDAANAGVDYIEEMCTRLKIPKFSELEVVDRKDFERLATTAANAYETNDNPVMMYKEDFIALFEKLYNQK
ncbi:alcohol dehydrogenase [bioreactor metagenome]|uniref:Alcohol dehydrogenase n=1 Tax=bioreactor metagenome TaxID=1076179 RepID=A0A645B723_9ZZZZ|nr:iron-containing alcohol dehydrogenase [Candidatus Metalachnospira sp.]